MTEIFFVLTVIYAAYVIFVTVKDKKPTHTHIIDDSAEGLMHPEHFPHVVTTPLIPEKAMAQPLVKPVTKTATPKIATTKTGLKNPETGEIATSYGNYRFMKRWIKEALVAEGLLEKNYKNNEITAEIETKIKEAIGKLEEMPRYQV